jgi:hypothetical protein
MLAIAFNKLADSISEDIGSIRNQIFQSTRDKDNPMSS